MAMSESESCVQRFFNWMDAWAKNEHLKGEIMNKEKTINFDDTLREKRSLFCFDIEKAQEARETINEMFKEVSDDTFEFRSFIKETAKGKGAVLFYCNYIPKEVEPEESLREKLYLRDKVENQIVEKIRSYPWATVGITGFEEVKPIKVTEYDVELKPLGLEVVNEDVMRKISKDMQDPKNHTVKLNVDMIKNLGEEFHKLIMSFPACREYSLAMTKIEEAVMWAVKGATR